MGWPDSFSGRARVMSAVARSSEPALRTLAITQNITVDGSIEMLGGWFDPQGQAGMDNSDLLEELHRQTLIFQPGWSGSRVVTRKCPCRNGNW
jgi:hypothetical protein